MFSLKLKSYKDCFDLKNAEMLFTHENEDHVIDFKFEKKLSNDSFYAFSKKNFKFYEIIYWKISRWITFASFSVSLKYRCYLYLRKIIACDCA